MSIFDTLRELVGNTANYIIPTATQNAANTATGALDATEVAVRNAQNELNNKALNTASQANQALTGAKQAALKPVNDFQDGVAAAQVATNITSNMAEIGFNASVAHSKQQANNAAINLASDANQLVDGATQAAIKPVNDFAESAQNAATAAQVATQLSKDGAKGIANYALNAADQSLETARVAVNGESQSLPGNTQKAPNVDAPAGQKTDSINQAMAELKLAIDGKQDRDTITQLAEKVRSEFDKDGNGLDTKERNNLSAAFDEALGKGAFDKTKLAYQQMQENTPLNAPATPAASGELIAQATRR